MSTNDKDNDQNTDLPLEDAEVHNDREHDDDPDMRADGNGSPDYLATPKRGKGVRRLNNKPLFVVGGVILLAVAGVSYTFFQRQAAQVAPKAEGDGPPVATVAAPPCAAGWQRLRAPGRSAADAHGHGAAGRNRRPANRRPAEGGGPVRAL